MPVLSATRVGVRSRRRWLFRDLDLRVDDGQLVAVVGAPGSGRTTLLLALTGRFRLSAGKLHTDGVIALGHVPGVHEPEPMLTVAEHVRERLLLLGRSRAAATTTAGELYGLDPDLPGWRLSPYQRQLLGLALARLSGPRLIALDGLDDGLDGTEQAALRRVLTELAATGVAVVVTARAVDPDLPWTVVPLGEPAGEKPGEAPEPGGQGPEPGGEDGEPRSEEPAPRGEVVEIVDGPEANRVDGPEADRDIRAEPREAAR